ncbi:MAG: YbaB/EbfC family nucleoid-associated protein [Oligoflexia bacterium]|nr:YbaB/EbfC family nucleoid-associated protein [Oligoflexia bacterium]MBF0364786.1 YbaB/EbfC family nucleoid-associated protein [Oligoflexia bacterium]
MKNNLGQLVKQAQQMQLKISALQNELAARELETSVGGGAIKIKINGKQEILELKISKECIDLDDIETLENLVKTAVNQAVKESNEMVSSAMSKVTGGLKIPGLF